jgi:hypothetical protein
MALKNLWKLTILFSSFLLYHTVAFSQIATTPYSLYGLGTPSYQGDVYSSALGYSAIALSDSTHINPINPASFHRDSIDFTFDFAFLGKFDMQKTNTNTSSGFTANMNHLLTAFRFNKWWGTSIGLLPFSSCNYSMKFSEYKEGIDTITHYLNGMGGINKLYWSNGFYIKNKLGIGITASYIFGYKMSYNSVVLPGGENYFNTTQKEHLQVGSFTYELGMQYHFNLYGYKMILGAIYSPKQQLKSRHSILNSKAIYIDYNRLDTISYTEDNNYKIDLPEKFGVGLSIQKGQWLVTSDFLTEKWSQTNWNQGNLQNRTAIHAGIEFSPKHNVLSAYQKKIKYRAGFYKENTNLFINGQQISKQGITIGGTFPLKKKKQSINLALDFGKFGTLASNLLEDYYVMFRIGMNLHETWFVKPKIN